MVVTSTNSTNKLINNKNTNLHKQLQRHKKDQRRQNNNAKAKSKVKKSATNTEINSNKTKRITPYLTYNGIYDDDSKVNFIVEFNPIEKKKKSPLNNQRQFY